MEDYDLEIDGNGRVIDERGGEESDDGGDDVVYRDSEEEEDEEATLGSTSRGQGRQRDGRRQPTRQCRRANTAAWISVHYFACTFAHFLLSFHHTPCTKLRLVFYLLNLADSAFYQKMASQVELSLFNVLNRYNYILLSVFQGVCCEWPVNGPYKTWWFPYQLNLADRIGQRKDSERWALNLFLNVNNVFEDCTSAGRAFQEIIARGKKLFKDADFFVRGTG